MRPGKGPGERQAPGPGKIKAPARCLPGRLRCVPALQLIGPRVALRPFQGRVADGCAAWGGTVALHGGGSIAMANGDAWTDAFGVNGDGHSMPLSPTIKVR